MEIVAARSGLTNIKQKDIIEQRKSKRSWMLRSTYCAATPPCRSSMKAMRVQ